jgi:hypothetical protein
VQDGKPMEGQWKAIYIQKQNVEWNKTKATDSWKGMWVTIHCFKTWGHHIGSEDVVVWTDNFTLKYFTTQPKLSSEQVRWQDTLLLFNVDIRH